MVENLVYVEVIPNIEQECISIIPEVNMVRYKPVSIVVR